jgi:acyl carrier protein
MTNTQKLCSIVSAVLGIPEEQVTDGLSSDHVETWDSLNHINLIGALEQEFGLALPTSNLGDFMSVRQLRMLLADHGVVF